MAAAPATREKAIEVDRLERPPASLTDYGRKRTAWALVAYLLDFLEQLDQLGERDFTAPFGREDGSDFALLDPSVKRRLSNAKQTSRFGGPDRGSYESLKELARGCNVVPYGPVYDALSSSEPKDVLDCRARIVSWGGHEPYDSSKLRNLANIVNLQSSAL